MVMVLLWLTLPSRTIWHPSARSTSEQDTPVFGELCMYFARRDILTYHRISRGIGCRVWCQSVACVERWTRHPSSGVAGSEGDPDQTRY